MWYRVHHSHKLGYCLLQNQYYPLGLDELDIDEKTKANIRNWIGRVLSAEYKQDEFYDQNDVACIWLDEENPTETLELYSVDEVNNKLGEFSGSGSSPLGYS